MYSRVTDLALIGEGNCVQKTPKIAKFVKCTTMYNDQGISPVFRSAEATVGLYNDQAQVEIWRR